MPLFLLSTAAGQLGLAAMSGFGGALSSVIVENLPFQHVIADGIVSALPGGADDPAAAPTLLAALALPSFLLAAVFFLLAAFRLGHATHLFPRHILLGCIGGIGLFLIKSGVEVATATPWPDRLDDPALAAGALARALALYVGALARAPT